MIDPANQEILDDLSELGVRRRPPLGFLPRGHLINRWLGLFRGRGHDSMDAGAAR